MAEEEVKKLNWLNRALLYAPIYYCLCLREKDFIKETKRLGVKNPPDWIKTKHAQGTTHFFERSKGISITRMSAIVCLADYKNRPKIEVYGLLVHEAVHIWQEIKELLGEESPSKEFEAYSVQNITQNLMESFQKYTGNRSKKND